jgi:hypothetical protein
MSRTTETLGVMCGTDVSVDAWDRVDRQAVVAATQEAGTSVCQEVAECEAVMLHSLIP